MGPDNLEVIAASNIGAVVLDKPSKTVFVACRGTVDYTDVLLDIEGEHMLPLSLLLGHVLFNAMRYNAYHLQFVCSSSHVQHVIRHRRLVVWVREASGCDDASRPCG